MIRGDLIVFGASRLVAAEPAQPNVLVPSPKPVPAEIRPVPGCIFLAATNPRRGLPVASP